MNQWDSDVRFVAPVNGGNVLFRPGKLGYHLTRFASSRAHEPGADDPEHNGSEYFVTGHLVEVNFEGADKTSPFIGSSPMPHYYNFFYGRESSKWASGVRPYREISSRSMYPGIDLNATWEDRTVKYEMVVSPGADPSLIRMTYEGVDDIQIVAGDLVISTPAGWVTEKRPVAYQEKDGMRTVLRCDFKVEGRSVSFLLPDGYDACETLVIDPLLIFSTYSGSTADNWGSTATPAEGGRLYSAGVTNEYLGGRFPATPGSFQTVNGGGWDIGILKYDSTGSQLLFATLLGGTGTESPHSLVVNQANELILLGTTSSDDFPVTPSAFDTTFNGGTLNDTIIHIPYALGADIIVAKFSQDGTQLVASTFLGGSANDGINIFGGPLVRNYGDELRGDVFAAPDGRVYVCSVSSSEDFPLVSGLDESFGGGGTDAIVACLDADLGNIQWSTFLGGTGTDAGYSIKLDNDGRVHLAGGTTSPDFPVANMGYQSQLRGDVDGWLCTISADGSSILAGTFTGTAAYDQAYFLDLNVENEIYVYGQTTGNFPVSPGVYSNPGGKQFVQKFDASLTSLIFSTVFGSGRALPDISPTAFLVNECNNLYMTGWGGAINRLDGYWQGNTSTRNMPVTVDAFQGTTEGSDFYFMVMTDDGKDFLYGTYMGGRQSHTHVDGGTSRFDKQGVVYHAVCAGCFVAGVGPRSDFPSTPGAWSRFNGSPNCNNAAFKFDLSSLRAVVQTNTPRYDNPGVGIVCIPDSIRFQNRSIGGETFVWDLGDGTSVTLSDSSSVLHAYTVPGQYTVRLKAIDQGTCNVVDSTATTIRVFETGITVEDDANLCEGSSHTLVADGGATYFWISADSSFSSAAQYPVVSPRDTTLYLVRVIDANGCAREDSVTLSVIPAIQPDFTYRREPECGERPAITIRNTTDSLETGDTFVFHLGNGETSSERGFTHSYEQDGLYEVTLRAERHSCIYESTTKIPVFTLLLPNVITPDGDGRNDFLIVQYGSQGSAPGDYGYNTSLVVYDRWGGVVFRDNDYRNNWAGQGLSTGIYYYEVKVESNGVCRGWLQIVR